MSNLTRPIQQIETEINILKVQTAQNIIEIGKRLIEAKSQLQHGEWGIWLESKVEFSQDTARNFPVSKIYALLNVPAEDRQQFIEEKHEVNGQEKTVDEMTTRELQTAIKARQEAEERANRLERELNKKELYSSGKDLEIRQLKLEISGLQNQSPEIKEVEKIPDDYETLKRQVESLRSSERKLREETTQAKNEASAYKTSLENKKTGGKSFEAISLPDFKFAVRSFLKEVTPLVYLGEQFAGIKGVEIDKFREEIDTVERWICDIRQALAGNSGGANLIVL